VCVNVVIVTALWCGESRRLGFPPHQPARGGLLLFFHPLGQAGDYVRCRCAQILVSALTSGLTPMIYGMLNLFLVITEEAYRAQPCGSERGHVPSK